MIAEPKASTNTSQKVAVAGAQTIYVLPTGALAFVEPGGVVPSGALVAGFAHSPSNTLLYTGLNATGFLVCPADSGSDSDSDSDPDSASLGAWQVVVKVAGIRDADVPGGKVGDCQTVSPQIAPVPLGSTIAWQYE